MTRKELASGLLTIENSRIDIIGAVNRVIGNDLDHFHGWVGELPEELQREMRNLAQTQSTEEIPGRLDRWLVDEGLSDDQGSYMFTYLGPSTKILVYRGSGWRGEDLKRFWGVDFSFKNKEFFDNINTTKIEGTTYKVHTQINGGRKMKRLRHFHHRLHKFPDFDNEIPVEDEQLLEAIIASKI